MTHIIHDWEDDPEAAAYEKSRYARLLKKLPPEEIPVAGDLSDAYLDTPSFKLAGNRRASLIVIPRREGRTLALRPGD